MVPREGIEPSWPCGRKILSLVCLPVPPSRQKTIKQVDYTLPKTSVNYFFRQLPKRRRPNQPAPTVKKGPNLI